MHTLDLDEQMLAAILQLALDDETAAVVTWAAQPLDGGFSGAAVYRVQGRAQLADQLKSWSFILKILSPATGGQAPTDFDYWQREALLYRQIWLHPTVLPLLTWAMTRGGSGWKIWERQPR